MNSCGVMQNCKIVKGTRVQYGQCDAILVVDFTVVLSFSTGDSGEHKHDLEKIVKTQVTMKMSKSWKELGNRLVCCVIKNCLETEM